MIKATARHLTIGLISGLCLTAGADPLPRVFNPVSSYSAGMGFCGVAIPMNPATIFWNPGGLGIMEKLSVDFTVATPSVDFPGNWSMAMANSSSAAGGRYGLGITRRSVEWNDEYNLTSFSVVMPFSYGFLSGSLPMGVSLKLIGEEFQHVQTNREDGWHYGTAVDIGGLWVFGSGVKVGYARHNIIGGNLSDFESETWFGASWNSADDKLTFTVQSRFDKPLDWSYLRNGMSFGVNYDFGGVGNIFQKQERNCELRGGYKIEGEKAWFTAGFAYIRLDDNWQMGWAGCFNKNDWKDQAHFLNMGYSIDFSKPPSSKSGIWLR